MSSTRGGSRVFLPSLQLAFLRALLSEGRLRFSTAGPPRTQGGHDFFNFGADVFSENKQLRAAVDRAQQESRPKGPQWLVEQPMVERDADVTARTIREVVARPLGILEHRGERGERHAGNDHRGDARARQVLRGAHRHVEHPAKKHGEQPRAHAHGVEERPNGVGPDPADGILQHGRGRGKRTLRRVVGDQRNRQECPADKASDRRWPVWTIAWRLEGRSVV